MRPAKLHPPLRIDSTDSSPLLTTVVFFQTGASRLKVLVQNRPCLFRPRLHQAPLSPAICSRLLALFIVIITTYYASASHDAPGKRFAGPVFPSFLLSIPFDAAATSLLSRTSGNYLLCAVSWCASALLACSWPRRLCRNSEAFSTAATVH
ncbi:hypothetical protein IQ06DRAFT_17191 [Phaeosphaeriaceae sp. SRC1lsM3a]|nr:hypothetical protein IQ06DRAFT_17191 [Stagonospora sp. SRC1lsM3a]